MFLLIAVPFISFFCLFFFIFIPRAEERRLANTTKGELAHVENKLEQFIVILRDIFELFPFYPTTKKSVGKWNPQNTKKYCIS